jgi:hypothetical protein
MQQASNLRDRLVKAIDETLAANAAQMAAGACADMETYRYMVGMNEALEATKQRVIEEWKLLNRAITGEDDDES